MKTDLSKALQDSVLDSGWSQGNTFDVAVKDVRIPICLADMPRYTLESRLHNAMSPT